jgi:peptide/nickel transport system substrate-binding protein
VRARRTTSAGTAILASLVVLLAACGSSSSGGGGGGVPGATNNAGTPQRGGTLNLLGVSDVDYMDPTISYYTLGYLNLRMWSRQLYTYPGVAGKTTTVVPDLATAEPTVSSSGLQYKVTIKPGVMWDTSPARTITAADVVRGVKTQCNPAQPFGGLPDFETLIKGMSSYCAAFAKVKPTAPAMAAFINGHTMAGVKVDPSNPETVVFTLTRPATYFTDILAIPAFSPAPVESLKYIPGSAQYAQNTISDGPYKVASYNPAHTITYVRNPDWKASTDTIRKAYVDVIKVNETGNQASIQQQLAAGTPAADMGWDATVPPSDVPGLISSKSSQLVLGPSFGTNPYLVYNTVSPNDNGAMGKVAVRQALNFAINRTQLVQDDAGPQVSPPLTHILPPGIDGSQNYDPYPYNVAKAKAVLSPMHLHLKMIYRAADGISPKMFQTLQNDLSQVGVNLSGVSVPDADFFTKYMEVPAVAKRGVWDMSLTSWGPDWYGNAALSFLGPLFSGKPSFAPQGSNFGYYDDPKTDALVTQASNAKSLSAANALWAKADHQVMTDAAIFPITSPRTPLYFASQVHNAVFISDLNQFDPTNVWLTPSKNGG